MRNRLQKTLVGALAAVLSASCAAADVTRASLMSAPNSADMKGIPTSANAQGSAESAGDEYLLVPRQPGDAMAKIIGRAPVLANNGADIVSSNGGTGASGAAGDSFITPTDAIRSPSPEPPLAAAPGGLCEETATVGLFGTSDRPVLASGKGVFAAGPGGTWSKIADKFPCGTVPAAIAPGGSAWYAAAGDGIYRADRSSSTWTLAAAGSRVVDLDITPDGSAGVAVQEDGRPFLFGGEAWSAQTYKLAPEMGGVRILSATESYAVGQGVLGFYDGQTWTPIAQPDASNLVAGLAVRRTSSNAASLVATTRSGLYRWTTAGWVAELGPDPSLYLGLPAFWGALGFACDLGTAEGHAYTYSAATWQAAPAPPIAVETTAVLPDGAPMVLSADGESLHVLSGDTWVPVSMP